ncbi:putative ribosomal protein L2 [Helianthus annuus]|nr:putative ribosomal protein L2 [Helianthus annuus]
MVIHTMLLTLVGCCSETDCKRRESATLKLPSREIRLISKNCSATVGQVGKVGVNQKNLGRAGSKRWLGKRPVVRGVVMNPVDHPHVGGERRAPIGRKKTHNPLGLSALGKRNRKRNKYSDNLILRRRSK